jgi:succinate dehydrogenase / fumarate reductase membrane anchor subunit
MAVKDKFKSDLAIAKNLGSAGSGSEHWWRQRLTAIIMVLSVFWLVYFFIDLSSQEIDSVILIIKKPYNIVMLALFTLVAFYHSALGMQVVIEDYVTCRLSRLALLLLVQIFSLLTMVAFLVALLYVMIL